MKITLDNYLKKKKEIKINNNLSISFKNTLFRLLKESFEPEIFQLKLF